MRTDEFDFDLPERLIAQHPPERRGASRLLHVHDGVLEDRRFAELVSLVGPEDVLVLNDTRVIKARLFGEKESGGKIEVLVERVLGEHEVLAQVRASHAPGTGSRLLLAGEVPAEVLGREGEFFRMRFTSRTRCWTCWNAFVNCPCRPISPSGKREDEQRYQTVYAGKQARWPRPAGLHFDDAMLQASAEKVYGSLCDAARRCGNLPAGARRDVHEHTMHSERYQIPQTTVDAIAATRSAADG